MDNNTFLNQGFQIVKLNKLEIQKLKKKLISKIKKRVKIRKINLDYFHKLIDANKINNLRVRIYNDMNKDEKFKLLIYKLSKGYIDEAVGSEIATSSINLSIQYPQDKNSLLKIHTDFFSGESLFQVNMWIPFVNARKTKSMFIINPDKSIEILKKIKTNKNFNLGLLEKKYAKFIKWIDVKFGQGLIFSPNCLHGNVVNKEKTTRWSINVRYKNIYSPYNNIKGNEKKLGIFYKPLTPKLITKFNLKYEFDQFQK